MYLYTHYVLRFLYNQLFQLLFRFEIIKIMYFKKFKRETTQEKEFLKVSYVY